MTIKVGFLLPIREWVIAGIHKTGPILELALARIIRPIIRNFRPPAFYSRNVSLHHSRSCLCQALWTWKVAGQ